MYNIVKMEFHFHDKQFLRFFNGACFLSFKFDHIFETWKKAKKLRSVEAFWQ